MVRDLVVRSIVRPFEATATRQPEVQGFRGRRNDSGHSSATFGRIYPDHERNHRKLDVIVNLISIASFHAFIRLCLFGNFDEFGKSLKIVHEAGR